MPPTIARKTLSPSLKSKLREASALPSPKAAMPTITIRIRPVISISVKTTFAFSDSATPRMFSAATQIRKPIETAITGTSESIRAESESPAKPRARVEAEVIPEAITAKATMKVKNWIPKALFV